MKKQRSSVGWRFLAPRASAAFALAVGLGLCFSFLAALEISLRYGLFPNVDFSPDTRARKDFTQAAKKIAFPAFVKDPFMDLREKEKMRVPLSPLQKVHEKVGPDRYRSQVRTAQNDLLYDVTYRYQEGRRITPGQPAKSPLSILMMGCSFTLGEGLEEDQTLPAFLQRLTKNASVHNASWHGWGPGDLLLSIRQADPEQWPSPLKNLPKAPKTIGVFVLGDAHFQRIECGIDCHGTSALWLRARPDFQLDENGQLVYRGRMRETRWFPRWLEFLADSAIATKFQGIGRFGLSRQEKMAKILISLRNELAAKTELQDFYVFHHPQRLKRDLTPLNDTLRAAGIKILDPKLNIQKLTGGRATIPVDNHPSPQQNYLLAEYLKTALNLNDHFTEAK